MLDRIIPASTNKGDPILDPFCGSATTGVAAIRQRRCFVGIESAVAFTQLAVERLKQATAQALLK